ncbi:MAG: hypothetical protein ACFFDN_18095, partial [Candidatus Hodarchaeota archaeon]
MLFETHDNSKKIMDTCPYCKGKNFIKKGRRVKKHESVQIYYCKKCSKKFTPAISKNKTFPLRLILDAITLYNRLYTLEESKDKVSEKYGIKMSCQNIRNWLKDFAKYLPFSRMRKSISNKYNKRNAFIESKMFHGQIYNFKYHKAKTELILKEDFKNQKFRPMKNFLDRVIAECPHNIFKTSQKRASDYKGAFDLEQVKIEPKNNTAIKNARFILQAIANNKLRHEILQEFMLINDSVTIAVEIPILLSKKDVSYYKERLKFNIPLELNNKEFITGHIDLIQIRNGVIYIMDNKPNAKKVKPIGQLMIYALALSRLTTLRLYHFKCAWFDDEDYFEFYPLHV